MLLIITGLRGSLKHRLAVCVRFGKKACRDGFSVLHHKNHGAVCELAVAHVDGSIGRVLLKLSASM